MKNFRTPASLDQQPASAASHAAAVAAPTIAATSAVRRYVRTAAFVLLTLGGASLASPALGQEAKPVDVQKVNETAFRVRIQNPTQGAGKVRVISLVTGQTLMYQRYEGPAYGCNIDFRDLQTGQYALLMQVGQSKYRYIMQVKSNPQTSVVLRSSTVRTRLPKTNVATASL
ncbi:hypothetical protein [Hymenobacter sp. GOD-10R]|uniref:hypothetical protein n=1 Tax=Hymenobacter sp. GOD-10R TaxID=3093922 RepID=UPI002D788364|nr:hypothetical protein [Hymenobacter sp. GOD-10R]WRQ28772.1 hypothetical protein SD425_00650 [Hymenobacter sp. GOD-10R]